MTTLEKSKLYGKRVEIKTNSSSCYAGEWGIVMGFDGYDYHVALWGGHDDVMVFGREEFTVKRNKQPEERG